MLGTILRRHDVERATGLPRSTIYAKIASGEFPKPIQLSARAVGWLENEIIDWQTARINARPSADRIQEADTKIIVAIDALQSALDFRRRLGEFREPGGWSQQMIDEMPCGNQAAHRVLEDLCRWSQA